MLICKYLRDRGILWPLKYLKKELVDLHKNSIYN